jgi:F0F1-type ATP synthase assembly protein I
MTETPDAPGPSRSEPDSHAGKNAGAARFEVMRTVGQVGSVGLSFVLAIAVAVAIGLWLDRVTGWSPLFFIVFFLLGCAAGVVNVYRITRLLK